jgi:hypothetical protein
VTNSATPSIKTLPFDDVLSRVMVAWQTANDGLQRAHLMREWERTKQMQQWVQCTPYIHVPRDPAQK